MIEWKQEDNYLYFKHEHRQPECGFKDQRQDCKSQCGATDAGRKFTKKESRNGTAAVFTGSSVARIRDREISPPHKAAGLQG